MQNTPLANRTHIGIYGNRNAGKSTLFNALLGQEMAVVSAHAGTTTDPVIKAMELIPYGPVAFIDTAGLDDAGALGEKRIEKTHQMLKRTDFAIYLVDGTAPDLESYRQTQRRFKQFNIPYMTVVHTKGASVSLKDFEAFEPQGLLDAHVLSDVHAFLETVKEQLKAVEEEPTLVGDLLPYGSTVVLVVPIDSEAPKGRIILPQVQLIRDCLDHGVQCHVVRDTELESALKTLPKVDLVITDSQAFKSVSRMVPPSIKLTSFSILFARQKGSFDTLLEGVEGIRQLKAGDSVLISESCTHNHSHEDIGRVKIPALLKAHVGEALQIDFSMGGDFPADLSKYRLVIHCGACMVNRKNMQVRIGTSVENAVPMTNYGLALAYFTGILDRSIEILGETFEQ